MPPSQSVVVSKTPTRSEVIPQEVIPVANGASNAPLLQKSTTSIAGQIIEGPAAGSTVTVHVTSTVAHASVRL